MSKSSKPALDALVVVSGFLRGQFGHQRDVPADVVEIVVDVQRGIGSLLERTPVHDAGAFARCSFCGRYTADPAALLNDRAVCDCGHADGWSGSFEQPGDTARWSTGLLAMRKFLPAPGEKPSTAALSPSHAPGAGFSLDGGEA
jgi:hypothetical protein